MPVTTVNPTNRTDPTPGYGFALELGNDIAGWFTECSGLSVEREIKAHPEGGVNDYVHQLPGRIKRSNITLKRGLAGNELWDWFQKGAIDGQVEPRNISIVLYDQGVTEVRRWDLVDVYPSKWSHSNFNSAGGEMAVETLELAYVQSTAVTSNTVQRTPSDQTSRQNGQSVNRGPDVDITALAKKIYKLLQDDLRIERERRGFR